MSADARAAAAESDDGGDEGDYDEDDEDNRHGIYYFISYYLQIYFYSLLLQPHIIFRYFQYYS